MELTLRTTPFGLRVCTLPVREISALYTRSVQRDGKQLAPGDANPLSDVRGGLYDIELEADLSQAKQAVLDIRGTKLVVRSTDEGLVLDNMKIPDTKVLSLRVVVDHTSMDVFFGKHGLYYSPRVTKPSPTKTLNLTITDGEVTLTRLRVHELKSIWRAD